MVSPYAPGKSSGCCWGRAPTVPISRGSLNLGFMRGAIISLARRSSSAGSRCATVSGAYAVTTEAAVGFRRFLFGSSTSSARAVAGASLLGSTIGTATRRCACNVSMYAACCSALIAAGGLIIASSLGENCSSPFTRGTSPRTARSGGGGPAPSSASNCLRFFLGPPNPTFVSCAARPFSVLAAPLFGYQGLSCFASLYFSPVTGSNPVALPILWIQRSFSSRSIILSRAKNSGYSPLRYVLFGAPVTRCDCWMWLA